MARSVTVNTNHTMVGGQQRKNGDTVTIENSEFSALTAAGRFTDGTLTDNGAAASTDSGDEVSVAGSVVAALGAKTSAAAAGANPTKAEFDAAVADIQTLYSKVNALISSLTGSGKPLKSS